MIILLAIIFLQYPAQPATAPSTMIASTTPIRDLSSPKSAAISLRAAVDREDANALASMLVAGDESQRKLNASYARLIIATRRLANAVALQFASSGDVMGLGALLPSDLKEIESATVIDQGDGAAQIKLPSQPRPLGFKREADGWHVDLIGFSEASTDDLPQQIAMLNELTNSMMELATDTRDGRFRTVGDLKAAVQDRVHGAIAKSLRHSGSPTTAATASSTQPATKPS